MTLEPDTQRHSGLITGTRDGFTSAERDRIKALECEVKERRRANEILKLASAFFPRWSLGLKRGT
jgi:transposase